MAVESTTAILQVARQRLLTYEPLDGSPTLAARIGVAGPPAEDGRIYFEQVPDDAALPFGVMQLIFPKVEGDDGHFRQTAEIELILSDDQRANAKALRAMADIAQAAMRKWFVHDASGEIVSRGMGTRSPALPGGPEPDRERMSIRLTFPIYFYSQYLTLASA